MHTFVTNYMSRKQQIMHGKQPCICKLPPKQRMGPIIDTV